MPVSTRAITLAYLQVGNNRTISIYILYCTLSVKPSRADDETLLSYSVLINLIIPRYGVGGMHLAAFYCDVILH